MSSAMLAAQWRWISGLSFKLKSVSMRLHGRAGEIMGKVTGNSSSVENKMTPAKFHGSWDIPVEQRDVQYSVHKLSSRVTCFLLAPGTPSSPLSSHSTPTLCLIIHPSLERTCNSFHLCVSVVGLERSRPATLYPLPLSTLTVLSNKGPSLVPLRHKLYDLAPRRGPSWPEAAAGRSAGNG